MATLANQINSSSIQGVIAQAVNNRLYLYSDGNTSDTDDSTGADGRVTLTDGATTWAACAISPRARRSKTN